MAWPNYSKNFQEIRVRNNENKSLAIKCIKRRLQASSDEDRPRIAANMVIRIYEGRVA